MSKFCKLFEIENHQVLVSIKFDEEEEEEFLEIQTQINGNNATAKLEGFKNEASIRKGLDLYCQEDARRFFVSMKNLLS